MTFGEAFEHMKWSGKVKLPDWKDDVYISIQNVDKNSKMTHMYMYVTSRFGKVPWLPTQVEIFREDWITV